MIGPPLLSAQERAGRRYAAPELRVKLLPENALTGSGSLRSAPGQAHLKRPTPRDEDELLFRSVWRIPDIHDIETGPVE